LAPALCLSISQTLAQRSLQTWTMTDAAENALLQPELIVDESGMAEQSPAVDAALAQRRVSMRLVARTAAAVSLGCLVGGAAMLSHGKDNLVKKDNGPVSEGAPQMKYDIATGPHDSSHELDFISPVSQSSIAICTIDAYQSIGTIGQMGIAASVLGDLCGPEALNSLPPGEESAIIDGRRLMGPKSKKAKVGCSADITYVIAQVAMVATLFSDMATKCTLTANLPAQCASDVAGLTSNLAAIAANGQNIWLSCKDHFPRARRMCDVPELDATREFDRPNFNHTDLLKHEICALENDDEPAFGRRLAGPLAGVKGMIDRLTKGHHMKEVARKKKQAKCSFSFVGAKSMLARIGININAATHTCSDPALGLGGDPTQCAVSVQGILAVMALAASSLSGMVVQCPMDGFPRLKTSCASAITGFIGSLSAAGAFSASLSATCAKLGQM